MAVTKQTYLFQVATTLGALLRSEKAKSQKCGVFGSFGWSGEAVDELEGRLKVGRPLGCLVDRPSRLLQEEHPL